MGEMPAQRGKFAVVTGANSGTGKEAAKALAGAGASVVLAVRTVAKGEDAKREILAAHPGAEVQVHRLDLADLASVKEFADSLIADGRPVDLLLNNAGVMMPPVRHETKDGFELQIGSNFLGPFALTVRLLPLILQARAPRVVTMSSGQANGATIRFDDLNWTSGYKPIPAYGQSKLADLLMSQHLAHLADQRGWPLLSIGAHPGAAKTNIAASGPTMGGKAPLILRVLNRVAPSQTPAEGARSIVLAATSPDVVQGGYYGPKYNLFGPAVEVKLPASAADKAIAARLWTLAEQLTGVTLPAHR
ncbi:SDR family oxidoreductase [Actinoplanes couchii]|uniref:Oxidoreductase n=1 Tax=Actinoplanes couchii TaxID=403638 RepID=A0ABQ3XJE8_9ACTN|nr:SDR family oxidoreductase [Actinoplanes couchii]MDR6324383.1 NAD(P)-dependent dehydrogenase (short-subunit alcohol dehydrogenase family) [Actinoplanes couchii]GID58618.1 oxidoreductase [Actinoplanes couchii]